MSLMEEVTALQDRLAEAQKARARAEGARESAQAALDSGLAELNELYGARNIEEAEVMLSDLRAELETLVTQISAKLDEIGI